MSLWNEIKVGENSQASVPALVRDLGVPPLVARLLVQRGCLTAQHARELFDLPSSLLCDGAGMLGMQAAIVCLLDARKNKDLVVVHGDYDLDGISGTALLTLALRKAGWNVDSMLPSRFGEGYGISKTAVENLHQAGAKWICTVDTGVTANQEISLAKSLGMGVIVIDHHRPSGDGLPIADVILDPFQPGCDYPNKALCAVGLCYKLVVECYKALGRDDAGDFIEFVALGTLADLVPLTLENRYLVSQSLRKIPQSSWPGIRALYSLLQDSPGEVGSQDISFRMAPLLNAPGRLQSPDLSLDLLMSSDAKSASALLKQLQGMNDERKLVEKQISEKAIRQVETWGTNLPRTLVLADKDWHVGVIGIVAAKVAQTYRRPCAVLAVDSNEIAVGSARSVPGFDWHAALHDAKDLLVRWGGHPNAAGFSIDSAKIQALRDSVELSAQTQGFDPDKATAMQAHLDVKLSELDTNLMEWLRRMEPFGPANPFPLFVARNVRLAKPLRVVRGGHLQMDLTQDGHSAIRPAVAFGMGAHASWITANASGFDAAFEVAWNVFNGRRILQLLIKGIAPRKS